MKKKTKKKGILDTIKSGVKGLVGFKKASAQTKSYMTQQQQNARFSSDIMEGRKYSSDPNYSGYLDNNSTGGQVHPGYVPTGKKGFHGNASMQEDFDPKWGDNNPNDPFYKQHGVLKDANGNFNPYKKYNARFEQDANGDWKRVAKATGKQVARSKKKIMKPGDLFNAHQAKMKHKLPNQLPTRQNFVKPLRTSAPLKGNYGNSVSPVPRIANTMGSMQMGGETTSAFPRYKGSKNKKKTLRSPEVVVQDEQNSSHQFYKKTKHKAKPYRFGQAPSLIAGNSPARYKKHKYGGRQRPPSGVGSANGTNGVRVTSTKVTSTLPMQGGNVINSPAWRANALKHQKRK